MNIPNFIEHEEDGRVFVIPEFELQPDENVDEFMDRERDSIIKAMSVAITQIVEFDLEHAPTFAVVGLDFVFGLPREEAEIGLDKCIAYFTEMEEYEKCAKLSNLKSKL